MTSETVADVLDIALRVAAAIESNGGQYFVGGSLASSLQGEPRATNDIDFVVSLPLGRLETFRASLGEDFELDVDMLRDALLLRVNAGKLDEGYLTTWSVSLGLAELLRAARDTAET